MTLEFTGERFIPGAGPEIAHEHYGRYLFAQGFCANKRVVDIPAGEGYGSALLAEVAADVTGVDIAADAVAHANAKYVRPNLKYVQGDLTTFDQLLTQRADVITCMEGIEHISAEAQLQALPAIKRALNDNGVLIISSPNKAVYTDQMHTHNEAHVHELYVGDFLGLVKPHFAHCYLFGQNMADAGVLTPILSGDSSNTSAELSSTSQAPSVKRYFLNMNDGAESITNSVSDTSRFTYMILVCSNRDMDLDMSGAGGVVTVDLDRRAMHMQRTAVARELQEQQAIADKETQEEIKRLHDRAAMLADRVYQMRIEREGAMVGPGSRARLAFLEYEHNRVSAKLTRYLLNTIQRMPMLMGIWRVLVKPVVRQIWRRVNAVRKAARVRTANSPKQARVATHDRRELATQKLFKDMEKSDSLLKSGYGDWCTDTNPEVSIIILNWNKADLTIRCLKEVWKYTTGHTYEIIVVDNGSRATDFIRLQRFPGKYKTVRVAFNRFFGEGNNIGAEAASGKYLVFLNNDAFVTPGWLEPLIKTFSKHDHVGAVGPMFLYADGYLQEAGTMVKPDGSVWMRGRELYPVPEEFKTEAIVDYCSAAALVIRTDLYLALHGFDLHWEPAYYEDADLCLRAKRLGWDVYYCPDTKIVHVEHATTATTPSSDINYSKVVDINKVKWLQRYGKYITEAGVVFDEPANQSLPADPQLLAPLSLTPSAEGANGGHRKQTVGIYTPFGLVPGGGERYLLTMAEHLSKTSTVILIIDEIYSKMRLATLGHELDLDLSRLSLISYEEARSRPPFDIFIAMGNEVTPPVPALGIRSFFHCQFPFPASDEVIVPQIPYLARYERVILNSEYTQRHYSRIAATYNLDPKPISVLAPPCFSESDPQYATPPSLLDSDLSDPIQIISVGRFFPGGHCKRHDVMIEALRQAQRQLGSKRKVELHLAGTLHADQDCLKYFADLVKQAEGLAVRFHPNIGVDTLTSLLRSSTFYWHATGFATDEDIYPEVLEHFGISVVEAMRDGCVPLVVNKGGPAATVVNGVSGMHYSTIAELASKTVSLIKNPKRLSAMRVAAFERASQFSKERFIQHLDEILVGAHEPAQPQAVNTVLQDAQR